MGNKSRRENLEVRNEEVRRYKHKYLVLYLYCQLRTRSHSGVWSDSATFRHYSGVINRLTPVTFFYSFQVRQNTLTRGKCSVLIC